MPEEGEIGALDFFLELSKGSSSGFRANTVLKKGEQSCKEIHTSLSSLAGFIFINIRISEAFPRTPILQNLRSEKLQEVESTLAKPPHFSPISLKPSGSTFSLSVYESWKCEKGRPQTLTHLIEFGTNEGDNMLESSDHLVREHKKLSKLKDEKFSSSISASDDELEKKRALSLTKGLSPRKEDLHVFTLKASVTICQPGLKGLIIKTMALEERLARVEFKFWATASCSTASLYECLTLVAGFEAGILQSRTFEVDSMNSRQDKEASGIWGVLCLLRKEER